MHDDVSRALDEREMSSPLDRLYQGQNHSRGNDGAGAFEMSLDKSDKLYTLASRDSEQGERRKGR